MCALLASASVVLAACGGPGGAVDAGPLDAGPVDAGPTCAGGCDDANPCTEDACGASGCTHVPLDGTSCDDADRCTTTDVCHAGACHGEAVVCPAPGACALQGACEPATGQCTQPKAPLGAPCSDGNAATSGDACDGAGACVGAPVICPTDSPCATWVPDGSPTCVATPHPGASCDDANPATSDDRCTSAGACEGTPVSCPANTACTTYAPNGTATCTATNLDGANCEDQDPCTPTGSCSAGACVVGPRVSCVNGGTCSNGACVCPAGWKGATCATDVDECATGACGGGSICTNTPGSYTCACQTNFSSPTGANCASTVPALEVVAFYDEGVERKFGPQTPARIASLFARAKAVYDSGLTPAMTLSLNGVSRLAPAPAALQYRTCDTVVPATSCTGCYQGGFSGSCGTLVSSSASEIDTDQLLQSLGNWFTTRHAATTNVFGSVDVVVLLTDADFAGSVIGLASVSGACHSTMVATVSTRNLTDENIGASLAHELGHTIGMSHDASQGYVMSATIASPPNTTFSAASLTAYQAWRAGAGVLSCISNVAHSAWVTVTCGNGVVDRAEQCDPSVQADSCCGLTCQLGPGCSCGNTEPCCANGALALAGKVCRAARSGCDQADTCDGVTGACPDTYLSPGAACANAGYCLRGDCVSRTTQCAPYAACESSTRCDRVECSQTPGVCDTTFAVPALNGTLCGSANQCVSGLCVPSASLKDYTWRVGAWSSCVTHVSTRPVSCVDEAGAAASSTLCDPDTQPNATLGC